VYFLDLDQGCKELVAVPPDVRFRDRRNQYRWPAD
jgi:hypothetical protein